MFVVLVGILTGFNIFVWRFNICQTLKYGLNMLKIMVGMASICIWLPAGFNKKGKWLREEWHSVSGAFVPVLDGMTVR